MKWMLVVLLLCVIAPESRAELNEPIHIRVPRYEAIISDCNCQDTTDVSACLPDDDPVTVEIEADQGWRRFYRQIQWVRREELTLVGFDLPAGWWRIRVRAWEPGGVTGCWSKPDGRVSIQL